MFNYSLFFSVVEKLTKNELKRKLFLVISQILKKNENFPARIYIIFLHIYLSTLVHINIYQSGVKFHSFTKSSNPHVLPDIFLLVNLVSYCI